MILVVEGELAGRATVVEALGAEDLVLATNLAEARGSLESTRPSAMLLAVPVDDAAGLIEDVRSDRFGQAELPIVAVVDDDRGRAEALGVDETLQIPVTEATVESAVERAVLLGRYKAAVDDFFDACRRRAEGTARANLPRSARRTADEYLAEIHARNDSIPFESLIEGA